jgi:hypothetical protein
MTSSWKTAVRGAGGHEIEHELEVEIPLGHPDGLITEAFREGQIRLQGGHDALAAGVVDVQLTDELVRAHAWRAFP